MKQIRPLGHILLDMEPLLEEAVDSHDLQVSDLIGIIYMWVSVHRPGAIEKYLDGSRPMLYTHKDNIKEFKKLIKGR